VRRVPGSSKSTISALGTGRRSPPHAVQREYGASGSRNRSSTSASWSSGRPAQGSPPEQATVLGEEEPVLPAGLLDEIGVGGVVAVRGVHTEQPQPPGERAEMDVEQQLGRAVQRLRSRASDDLDPLVGRRPPVGRDVSARDAQRTYLGERDTDALHEVPERGAGIPGNLHRPGAPPGREQEPQLRAHLKPDHVPARTRRRRR
jgi:hypothetical protein